MNRIAKFVAVAVAIVAVAGLTRSYGMAENWSAVNGVYLTLAGGTTGIPSGGRLEIGILGTNTVLGLQALQNNPVALEAAFQEWAVNSVGNGSGLDGTYDNVSSGPGAGFFATQMYMLVFNTASAGTATQVGLFTSADSAWLFPASDGAGANTANLEVAGLTAVIGALSSGTVTSPSDLAGGNAAQLHLVPEPSSIALAAIGLVGLVGFARRRRS